MSTSTFDPTAWGAADPAASYGDDWKPEPGDYEVAIETAETFESGPQSKSPGTPYIRMRYTMQGGQHNGQTWSEIRGLGPTQMPIQKAHCLALGVDPEVSSLEELDARLRAVVGTYRTVRVTQSGRYVNTKVLDSGESAPTAGVPRPSDVPEDTAPQASATAPVDDDDIPF